MAKHYLMTRALKGTQWLMARPKLCFQLGAIFIVWGLVFATRGW